MKRNILIMLGLIVLLSLATSCKSSKRCGCPTFGQIENAKGEWVCVGLKNTGN